MISKHICTNGVRIIHEKMPYVRSVALGVCIEAGSRDELLEEEGVAHFIEHMLFKGTPTRSARTIAEQFDRMGGDVNAFTSKDMTCFYATVLGDRAETAISILEDMIFHSIFDETEMEKEKSVVLEEIATVEDTPDDDVHERLWSAMYPAHPIGKPILGSKDTIEKFTKEMIMNFMNRNYKPERIVISVAGNYDDRLINTIEELFGSFQSTNEKQQDTSAETPFFYPGVTIKEKDVEQSHLCIGFPALALDDSRMYDLIILDSIIGSAMSSRLFQEVREERGLAYSIYSYYTAYENAGSFIIYGGTSPEKMNELYETIDGIIKSVLDGGVTEKEIEQAKEHVIGSFLLSLESTESRMSRNGRNEIVFQSHKGIDDVVSKIQAVDKEDIMEVAKEILSKERAISIIAPKETIDRIAFN
ncbi:M16 family metallopeptidase [Sporosarcina jiandibaonis]|uniref:M16 family metallopeptidase n=1 Tax=Sporosarcina jiandibaonis TaxID=2715535 RepID=UPI00155232F9|nr:pitrilysin family protein [Sporosarcina jiandibaonis]